MENKRSAGILLHPTSFPGPFGIGGFGSSAFRFIEFLASADLGLWQILPLGPTGFGDSPYQSFSAFAGNPYLISPEMLIEDGFLTADSINKIPKFNASKVDLGKVKKWKNRLFTDAFHRFLNLPKQHELVNRFEHFCEIEKDWLDDFALFSALKNEFRETAWIDWPKQYRVRDIAALYVYKKENNQKIKYHAFIQYLFFSQWKKLLDHAHSKQIKIIGDVPLFVAFDSVDVWAHPELFDLTSDLTMRTVAGVPPDYFSSTGQLWGNPQYLWAAHKKNGYQWWRKRLANMLQIVDIIRLDHFRGFSGFWEVPAEQDTAVNGRWVQGPGRNFFSTIKKNMGEIPIIAEDLGIITQDVVDLREEFSFPGMRVLQFGFGSGAENPFLPHNYIPNCIAFTGTHDNDTARGWFEHISQNEKEFCLRYLNSKSSDIAWNMIRAVWASCANVAIAPMQDFLNLGSSARMNFPGVSQGNWIWRVPQDGFAEELCQQIKSLNHTYGRVRSNSSYHSDLPSMTYEKQTVE